MALTPDRKAEIQTKAVEAFRRDVVRFHETGATLRETENGRVKPMWVIGGETYEPIPAFPKANLADEKWTSRTLSNLDAYVTKAQVVAAIEEAVADLPLTAAS